MIKRDLQFFLDRLADVTDRLDADPNMNDNCRKILADSQAYCIKQIKLLKYYEFVRGIIAAN